MAKKNIDYKKLARDFWYGKPHGERRLGDIREDKTGLYKHREWRGVKDTMYYFYNIWLYNYIHMVMDVMKYGGVVNFAKGVWRYRWVGQTYLPVLHWFDRGMEGMRGEALKAQIADAVERTGISGVKNRLISTLSKGYKQRVGIAQAIIGSPRVIILDEPTVGLDPIQIVEIRGLIRELGRTHLVIFSSHILSEVQTICERVLIISHGKLVADMDAKQGDLEETFIELARGELTGESEVADK